jgi:ubiquinone biosynthesis protein COQ4
VGGAYLDLVQRAGISPEELITASEEVARDKSLLSDVEIVYAQRLRDTHDLWHVATGYSTDTLGEVCVVAFSYAQTKNLGFAAIAVIGALKIARESGAGREVLRAVWQAYRNGRRAAWLPAVAWEDLLDQPLTHARTRLSIGSADDYRSALTRCSAGIAQAA